MLITLLITNTRRYSFRLPPYYTLLVRSLSVLEGIALASDPTYKVGKSTLLSVHDTCVAAVVTACQVHVHWAVFQALGCILYTCRGVVY